jgi:hypothetical protein
VFKVADSWNRLTGVSLQYASEEKKESKRIANRTEQVVLLTIRLWILAFIAFLHNFNRHRRNSFGFPLMFNKKSGIARPAIFKNCCLIAFVKC